MVVVLLAGSVGWWALSGDSREYPRIDERFHITKGDGDLEDDLLPHFQVRLTCETKNLRYGEWEDFGPAGWLALRFETDADCVRQFLFDNDLDSTPGAEIPMDRVPAEYGWHLAAGNKNYKAEPSARVRLTVSVDSSGPAPVVYAFATYE